MWFAASADGGRSFDAGRPLHPAAEVSDAPALAARGDRVVVAWHAKAGGNRRIFASASEDGGLTFTVQIDQVLDEIETISTDLDALLAQVPASGAP